MTRELLIGLAAVLAFTLVPQAVAEQTKPRARKSAPILMYDQEATKKPGKALKAKTGQKKGQFQIQHATSDLQNAENVRSQNKKTKGVKSK